MGYKRATLAEFRAELGRVKCACEGWSDCIQFAGTRGTNGYNVFRTLVSSTVAAYLVTGRFPSTVVHRCGNTNCVNFAHMSIHYFIEAPNSKVRAADRISKSVTAPTLPEVLTVLQARPESGRRYTLRDVMIGSGIQDEKLVRQALRYAPAIDVSESATRYRAKGLPLDKLLVPINEPLPTGFPTE